MRITNNMLIGNMVGYLSENLAAMAKYQAMASTGKLIQKASEDPVVAARTLKLNTDKSVLSQYKKNADSAIAWMETTETALRSLDQQLLEIRTRIVQASNGGTLADEDRQAIAGQVKQLKDEIISLANSTYTGRYIFSGYKSDTPLMDGNGFFNVVVSSLEKINYEVGVTNKLQVNVTGDSLFNLGQPVGYLPARSALVQDIDDALAMLDAKATVIGSAPLDLNGPGVFDMSGISVNIDLGGSAPKTVNFDEANVPYVNRMAASQIIGFINKKLGAEGTASLDKYGNIIVRSYVPGGAVSVADADTGVAGPDVRALFGENYTSAASVLTGSKSLTEPALDVSGFNQFTVMADRPSTPIVINLSTAAGIKDLKNARIDEIAAEINSQIADQVKNASAGDIIKWVKCTLEDGRLCLTSESFGSQSSIDIAGGQEIYDLFGVAPSYKQGNAEQQGMLVGSRDFREPVADVTKFRNPDTGEPPAIRVLINGVFLANLKLDDGDPAIDPRNMTLRQIIKKIDDQLGAHGTCDIDEGRLVLRSSVGGSNSAIEIASVDEAFYEFLFGTDPVVKNGANEPTHGFYKSGVAYKFTETVNIPAGFEMNIHIDGATGSPLSLKIKDIPAGASLKDITDYINRLYRGDAELAKVIKPENLNNYNLAVLIDGSGNQLYPPLNGAPAPEDGAELFLKIQSHTWGTGSGVKIEGPAPSDPPNPAADAAAKAVFEKGMAELFGKGTANAPVVMGGVDGLEEEICRWLDVADAQLANLNRLWTDLGARMARGELTQDRLELDKIVSETLLSENASVDEAKALMLLQIAETVYNASLAVGARVIQPSLLDFLS